MAKKKKNRLSNDIRGYVTKNSHMPSPPLSAPMSSSPLVPNIPVATNRVVSKVPVPNLVLKSVTSAPSSRMQITSDVQDTLEKLLFALHILREEESLGVGQETTAVTTKLPPLTALENNRGRKQVDAAKLRRRVGTIYDSLMEYGFDFQQIQEAIAACSTNVTLLLALDWLCYNIPTSALPKLFTEGLIRESESRKNIDTVGVTLIPAVPSRSPTVFKDVSPPSEPLSEMSLVETREPETGSALKEDEAWNMEQKAILLAQYEFGSSSESDDESPVPLVSSAHANGESSAAVSMNISKDSSSVEKAHATALLDDMNMPEMIASRNTSSQSIDCEIHLHALKGELSVLDNDLTNEANNYMRSKCEINDLKRKSRSLRKEVSILEAKLRRLSFDESPVTEEFGTNSKLEDDQDDVLFSIFEDDDDNEADLDNTSSSLSTPAMGHFIPDDSLPVGWTGQTPKAFLEELCRKEKSSKPSFEKLSLNGCRLHLTRKTGKKSYEDFGPHTNYQGVQHFLSMKALYEITPSLPLYRLFPPFYRDIWINWINSEKQEKLNQSGCLANIRSSNIDTLMECINLIDASYANETKVARVDPTEKYSYHSRNRSTDFKMSNAQNTKDVPSEVGKLLQEDFERRKDSHSYKSMQSVRSQLPIYSYRELILETIKKHPVTILCAETGSGKTTQCGSFVLEEALCKGIGDRICVLCTQPRRVAAMSVAERVAAELGEWNVGNLVGYQIRMEAKRSSETRILFCTTGVILRRMIDDPELKGISHVLVDEVHERQWQVDVLLVALRSLIAGRRPDLKLVLMSATLDAKLFGTFFTGSPCVNVPGRTFPVRIFYLEDLLEQTNHVIEEGSCYARRERDKYTSISIQMPSRVRGKHRETIEYESHQDFNDDFSQYSYETRSSLGRVDEEVINYDLIEDLLDELLLKNTRAFAPHLDCIPDSNKEGQESTGAVLIFLPGLEEIRTLMDRLTGSKIYGNTNQFQIVPLHSSLSSTDQRRAFMQIPRGCRKIVISTNVAETSVTIPDVVYVIDSGRVREITRNKKSNSRKLLVTWCSKASVKQRSGRAGRVQPGVCLKLYSSRTESHIMREATEPELLRIPLEEVCLTILAGGFGKNCSDFLSQAPQPPPDEAVHSAINVLEGIGAITKNDSSSNESLLSQKETLTSLGKLLAKLPVDARVGKMLIFGALFKCTDSIVTIAAFLSAPRSPFLSNVGDRYNLAPLQSQFLHPLSDFVTYVNLWNAFSYSVAKGKEMDFCRQNFLSSSAMRDIQYARRHYLELLSGLGFFDLNATRDEADGRNFDESFKSHQCNRNTKFEFLVTAVTYAGLFPNIACISRAAAHGDFTVYQNTERLHIQSPLTSKLTLHLPSSWITYYEKFGTERRVSISKIAFISTISLLLFSPKMQVLHTERKVIVDGWIEIITAAKTGVVFQEFQNRFADFLRALFDNISACKQALMSKKIDDVVDLLVVLLSKG